MNNIYESFNDLFNNYKKQLLDPKFKIIKEKMQLEIDKLVSFNLNNNDKIIYIEKIIKDDCYTKLFIFETSNKYVLFSLRDNEIVLNCGIANINAIEWLKKYYNNEIFKERLDEQIKIKLNDKIEHLDNTFYSLFMYIIKKNVEPECKEIIAYAKRVEWLGDTIEIRREYKRLTINCYKVASEMGSSDADLLLGRKYYAVYTTRELAFPYYEKAVERGNIDAMIEVAKYYQRKDEEKFLKYVNLAINNNSQEAKEMLKDYKNEKECKLLANEILKEIKQKTDKNCYEFVLNQEEPAILDSKIGGKPYVPIGEQYPVSKDGSPMALLIQINFNGIELNNYPTNGIFQVFSNQDFYKNEFIIKFYKEIDSNYQNNFPNLELSKFITKNSIKIDLIKSNTFMPMSDRNFNTILKEVMKNYKRKNGLREEIEAIAYPQSALLGGYADFTQKDVRKNKKMENYTECLIKLDNQFHKKLDIGDMGIINVLIKPDDLINGELEKAVVVWDCM
ncbi:MAG: DUF1963 domain-containing protein [Clostridia bacterium]|nr:DUF1963 domain-containing protein [Clostridia bacterium]